MFLDAEPAEPARLHKNARTGFERAPNGCVVHGCTTAVEDRRTWFVAYQIGVDAACVTRQATATGHSSDGLSSTLVERSLDFSW